MAEYDIPYDYFDYIIGPIGLSGVEGSVVRGENEVVRNMAGDSYTDDQLHLARTRSRSAESLAPSRKASAISLEPAKPSQSQNQSTTAPERYDITIRFPKMYDTGSVFRVKCCRKVETLVNFLLNLLERMERLDKKHNLTGDQSLNDFVKRLILHTATGHLSPEGFAHYLKEIQEQSNELFFINFLKAAFPRLARRFLKGDVAFEPFIPAQPMYDPHFTYITYDGHFLYGVYQEYYDRLVQNGEAPPIPQWIVERLPEYNVDSDDEDEPMTTGSEDSSAFTREPQPLRIFKGSMHEHSFLDPNKVRNLFRNTLREHCVVEEEAILVLTEAAQNRARDLIVDCAEIAKHRVSSEIESAVEDESSLARAKNKSAKKRNRGIESCYKSRKLVVKRKQLAKKKLEEESRCSKEDSIESPDVGNAKKASHKKRIPVVKVIAQDMQAVLPTYEVRLCDLSVRQHQTTMDSTPAENSLAIKDRKVKAKSAKKRKGQESYYKSRKLSRACKLRAKKKLEERPKGAEGQCAEDSLELPDVLPDAGNMGVAKPPVEVTARFLREIADELASLSNIGHAVAAIAEGPDDIIKITREGIVSCTPGRASVPAEPRDQPAWNRNNTFVQQN
ncbi:unnamed protein product [Cylicocyclus nassatus]|uniref:TAFH domain-containing protein n=1 Tax=Cylicocyclus nassatus TaxID=53992 RepID=A0AA36HGW6_CYLNA|nr:unnamed protein product [Cylicocyclus nassatus]